MLLWVSISLCLWVSSADDPGLSGGVFPLPTDPVSSSLRLHLCLCLPLSFSVSKSPSDSVLHLCGSQPSDLWEHLPSLPGDVWSSGLATSHLSSSRGPCPHPRGLQSPDWGEAAKAEGREKGSRLPRVTQLGGGEARECRGAQTGPAAEEPELDGGARSVLRSRGPGRWLPT